MVPERFRVTGRSRETERHLDARARAARPCRARSPSPPGSSTCSTRSARERSRSRSAATRPARVRWSTPCGPWAPRPRRSAPRAPGDGAGCAGAVRQLLAGRDGRGRRRGDRRRRRRAWRRCARSSTTLLARARALRPGRCCSTAAASPSSCSTRASSSAWRERGLEVDVTVDIATGDWTRQGRRRPDADRPGRASTRRTRSRSSAAPR